jgi:hypothetical protein
MKSHARQGALTPLRGKILLLVLSILFSLCLFELLLQLHYKISNKHWIWQDTAFQIHYTTPVSDRRRYALRPSYEKAGITIDREGFRRPKNQKALEHNAPLLVTLGDSVPFGAGVSDEETYGSCLDTLLQQEGASLRVINAGVPSYNYRQSIDRFKIDVLHHHKPVIVTLQAANDMSLLTYYRDRWNPDLTWADVRMSGHWAQRPGIQKCALFYYCAKALGPREAIPGIIAPGTGSCHTGPMLSNVKNELSSFGRFCRDQSITLILMPVDPFYYQTWHLERNATLSRWKDSGEFIQLWQPVAADINGMLSQIAREDSSIYFFDTRKLLDSEDRDLMYVDHIHYSPEGNRKVARALLEFMRKHRLLPH